MPYVTEELFQEFGEADRSQGLLISQSWPELDETLIDATADAEVDWVIRLITVDPLDAVGPQRARGRESAADAGGRIGGDGRSGWRPTRR